ncbi:xanthine dehydrogenase family protein molybdopterin-binding subunit [Palleronia sp.]|uniref:xanthine dehydrogenase family protein molybdopterin-binding subunit n=1 Tax=Palleronia sp. TaxID=1940284 RepID=UPI0035C86715
MARIGNPHDRIDGRIKVTGDARYAADFAVPNPLYGHLVISTIGKGRITGIDDRAARAVPGVRAIYTHLNQPNLQPAGFFGSGQGQAQQSWRPLAGPDVKFYGEIIGMVVAESILSARQAAAVLGVSYEAEDPAAIIDAPGVTVEQLPDVGISVGDVEAGMADAAHTVSQSYETAPNTHNAMELFATTAHWEGENLTVYVPSQWVKGFQIGLAGNLGIDPQRVRVLSPYVGGGFGGKGTLFTWTALVAAAARDMKRPVKLYVTREQGFTVASFRAETRQDVRVGAGEDGLITTFAHSGRELSSRPDTYFVNGAENTTRMYRADNIQTSVSVVHADRQTPGFMRAPPETPYFFALESAIDELARGMNMDPVELRIRNDVDHDPVRGVPFTSRSLVECYRQAGDAFGWSNYTPEVGSMADGDELIGWGVATSTYPTQMAPCAVRVSLDVTGEARVQVASHDLGTGAYTVFAQAVHEKLGVPVERIRVELGDSRLPPGTIAGGSVSTASNVSAIGLACDRILQRLGAQGGQLEVEAAFESYGQTGIEEYAEWIPPAVSGGGRGSLHAGGVQIVGGPEESYAAFAFGAQYVEVRINRFTREIRVPRIVGAFAAGRIMNEKTARSQYLGGMVWGIGHALLEVSEVDPRTGAYMNDNISEYLVPVNADIQQIDAILVPEVDTKVNPAGVKGIGEIGIVGTAAAIANAVYHATGIRVRKTPIHIEDILPTA